MLKHRGASLKNGSNGRLLLLVGPFTSALPRLLHPQILFLEHGLFGGSLKWGEGTSNAVPWYWAPLDECVTYVYLWLWCYFWLPVSVKRSVSFSCSCHALDKSFVCKRSAYPRPTSKSLNSKSSVVMWLKRQCDINLHDMMQLTMLCMIDVEVELHPNLVLGSGFMSEREHSFAVMTLQKRRTFMENWQRKLTETDIEVGYTHAWCSFNAFWASVYRVISKSQIFPSKAPLQILQLLLMLVSSSNLHVEIKISKDCYF